MKYLVVVQPYEGGYAAHAPDLEGCVARGRTRDQVERQIRAVIEFHVTGLRHQGREPPPPRAYHTEVELVAVEEPVSLSS